jgi:hypothetical protein
VGVRARSSDAGRRASTRSPGAGATHPARMKLGKTTCCSQRLLRYGLLRYVSNTRITRRFQRSRNKLEMIVGQTRPASSQILRYATCTRANIRHSCTSLQFPGAGKHEHHGLCACWHGQQDGLFCADFAGSAEAWRRTPPEVQALRRCWLSRPVLDAPIESPSTTRFSLIVSSSWPRRQRAAIFRWILRDPLLIGQGGVGAYQRLRGDSVRSSASKL